MEKCDTHQRIENDERYYYPEKRKRRISDAIFSVPLFYFKFYSPSLADSMSVSVNRRKYIYYYCLPGYENKIISQFDCFFFRPDPP